MRSIEIKVWTWFRTVITYVFYVVEITFIHKALFPQEQYPDIPKD